MKNPTLLASLACLLSIFTEPSAVVAQNLSVMSPANGTVVSPGQTVEADIQGSFDVIQLGCDKPLECTHASDSNGLSRWLVSVPSNALPGSYSIQAIASQLTNRSPIFSDRVGLTIPLAQLPTSLVFRPSVGLFRYVGDQNYFSVIGTMADGSTIDLTTFSQTSFVVPANISISSNRFTALAPGNGTIVATVTLNGASVKASLNVNVAQQLKGDLNGDGKVDTDDINILLGFKNRPASCPNDARDLNHDGIINALDARILTTLCTYPRCATHP